MTKEELERIYNNICKAAEDPYFIYVSEAYAKEARQAAEYLGIKVNFKVVKRQDKRTH